MIDLMWCGVVLLGAELLCFAFQSLELGVFRVWWMVGGLLYGWGFATYFVFGG